MRKRRHSTPWAVALLPLAALGVIAWCIASVMP